MCWAHADVDTQLGKHGKNITVNTVSPGITTTDILSPEAMDAFDKALTPMAKVEDRPGHPNDIADTILLLVQEKSRWITGQVRILNSFLDNLSSVLP